MATTYEIPVTPASYQTFFRGRDAVLFSSSANAAHGMHRTNADKRRAVLRLMDDPEWAAWSDRPQGYTECEYPFRRHPARG